VRERVGRGGVTVVYDLKCLGIALLGEREELTVG
jgi:hypothetical protein